MTETRSLWRGRALALVGVVLVGFSLRSAVAALSPILSAVENDVAVPGWVAGLIGTAPPVCFAVFGILTPALERRWGLERLAIAAMAVATLALIGRALSTDAGMLLLGTVVLFAAVGVGNVVLPPLIKAYFPDRVGFMTSLYGSVLAIAVVIPPLVAVPVAGAVGWRVSLGLWAVFALLAVVPWVTLLVRDGSRKVEDADAESPRVLARLVRLPLAWALAVSFAISSASVYASFAWLPAILVDQAGVSDADAGILLALFGAMGLPLSILVPIVVTRRRTGPLFVTVLVAGIAGVLGMAFAPTAATVLWVVLLGIPQALFSAALVLIQLRSRTPEGTVGLSGFVQSVGYTIAAVVPFLYGVLHEATGGWEASLMALGAMVLLAIPAGVIVSRPHTVEDDWERRHGAW